MKYQFVAASANKKTGPMPVTYTARDSCPPSCPHYLTSCYAEAGYHTRTNWDKLPARGINLEEFTRRIHALPLGQIWRANVAGDLPGEGEEIDAYALGEIVRANRGRRGFTYTHKKTAQALQWVRHAIEWGFTINVSADDAAEADRYAAQGFPVAVMVPMDTPKHSTTPQGRPILVCPAQTTDGITCATCQLCQKADRRHIVGFRAHGTRAKAADAIARRVIPIRLEN